jgi:hypothetical protein
MQLTQRPRIPRPSPRWLPTRNAMTIAVGVLASRAVVLAADTQLTVQNYWKGESGKIMAVHRRPSDDRVSGACAITGATDRFTYLHGLGDEISKAFVDGLDSQGKDATYQRFREIVQAFQIRNCIPNPDRPEVNVLVAYQRQHEMALWQSDRSEIVEQPDHGAVGIGSFTASTWLQRLWKPGLDVESAIIVAVFATTAAKESVDGCGHYTDVLVVQENGWRRIPREIVSEIDVLCRGFSAEIAPAMIMDCFGETPWTPVTVTMEQFKERIAAAKAKLREVCYPKGLLPRVGAVDTMG